MVAGPAWNVARFVVLRQSPVRLARWPVVLLGPGNSPRAEGEGRHEEEVHGDDVSGMPGQKGRPRRRGPTRCPAHVLEGKSSRRHKERVLREGIIVEPLVRAGVGSPGPWPGGAVVVETTGRKSGRKFNVPLLATLIGDLVLASTVRGRSQWLRNIAHTPHVRYWMHGRAREATALVVAPGLMAARPETTSPLAEWLAQTLGPLTQCFGVAFALLIPVTTTSGE
jgi:hypothetical protein